MDKNTKRYLIHGGLFLATLITTTIAGAEWKNARSLIYGTLDWEMFKSGFQFSIPFLLIFSFHEFGHYFTARYNQIKTTLPFYIPLPPFPGLIGTLGAVIRLKEPVRSTKQNFDIGISGPLAGFVIAIAVLTYGYTHLPEEEYVLEVHPEYLYFGDDYADYVYGYDTTVTKQMMRAANVLTEEQLEYFSDSLPIFSPDYAGAIFGVDKTMMIRLFESYVVPDTDKHKIPNIYELAHYPFLFAGYLALFFTALNLLPMGQLDGGHVVYGLFGSKWHTIIAMTTFFGILLYGGMGIVSVYMPTETILLNGAFYLIVLYWLLKATGFRKRDRWMYATSIFTIQFLVSWLFPEFQGSILLLAIATMVRLFVGVKHPPSEIEDKLDNNRVILGWVSLFILILCFTPTPFVLT